MWLGFRRYAAVGYGAEGDDPSLLPLDPIVVARRLRPRRLHHCFRFLVLALALIEDLATFEGLFREAPPSPPAPIACQAKYSAHLEYLASPECRLLVPCNYGEIRFFNGYFAVAKKPKDGVTYSRAIFNGRALSRLQQTPPPVCLPEIPSLLRRMSELMEGRDVEKVYFLSGDMRHWFHQFDVVALVGDFFGLRRGRSAWRWRGLPMGWSHSPRIAQATTWAMLLDNNLDCLAQERQDAAKSLHPPSWVYTRDAQGNKTGIIAVWYDNIVAMFLDHGHARAVQSAIQRSATNINAVFGEPLRTLILPTDVQPTASASPPVTTACDVPHFLGVQIAFKDGIFGFRMSDNFCAETAAARDILLALPSTSEKARDLSYPSRRFVARAVGRLIWHYYCRSIPLAQLAPILSLCRENAPRASPHAHKWSLNRAWDAVSPLNLSSLRRIADALGAVCENPITTPCTAQASSTYQVVSDSSSHSGGYVIMSGDSIISKLSWRWDQHIRPRSIFFKELLAATIAVEAFKQAHPEAVSCHLGVDNTAAAFAIKRGLSGSDGANALLERIFACFPMHAIEVTTILSAENAADPLTRGRLLDPVRNCATARVMKNAIAGWEKTENGNRYRDPADDSETEEQDLRHAEDDADAIFASFDEPEEEEDDNCNEMPHVDRKRSRE